MFCEEIRTKQDISYIAICSLRILYNSKFILMATSLRTNVVVVTRVQCLYAAIRNTYAFRGSKVFPFRINPFSEGVGIQESKREVTKVVSFINTGRKCAH